MPIPTMPPRRHSGLASGSDVGMFMFMKITHGVAIYHYVSGSDTN
jgi:hypothetical protein